MRPQIGTQVGLVSAVVGLALIGALAVYFRRRRRRPKLYRDFPPETNITSNATTSSNRSVRSQYGSLRKTVSPRPPSVSAPSIHSNFSDSKSDDTTIVMNSDLQDLTPDQLCDHGLEALQTAISHWELALDKLEDEDETDGVQELLHEKVQGLLQRGYRMQEAFEQRLFSQVNATVAMDAAIEQMNLEYEEKKGRSLLSLVTESSDQDSFVSALDLADLSDLEDQREEHHHLGLYEAALEEIQHGAVPCRTLRTKMLRCQSDSEFLAKLHCVRLAFQEIFSDVTVRQWFADASKDMFSDILIKTDRDPSDLRAAFEDMMKFVDDEDNRAMMEEELRLRGVKMFTFYDVVIDFMVLDAFDDLQSPPSSFTSVVQNRWLSNGFKEAALSTAVWSVLKAKKRMLTYSSGFISHFYAISEHITPVLAWGFLGPPSELHDLCQEFKEQVLEFMSQVFSFNDVRYTNVTELSADILQLMRQRQSKMSDVLTS